jgi:AraC family transcriptional regulator
VQSSPDGRSRDGRHEPSPQRAAFEICSGVIAGPSPTATDIPERDALLTTRWPHHEMHDFIPGLPVHVIGTYYGAPAPRSWRIGRSHLGGVVRPGGISVIPATWSGHWDIEGKSPVSYVMLSDSRLQELAGPFSRGRPVELRPRLAEPDPVGAHILRALCREATCPSPGRRLFVEQALDLLCTHLLRAHSSSGGVTAPIPARGLPPWQVRRVTAYMTDRLDQSIGLGELAALTSLSRSHFCTAFRHATGRTPHEWLTALRMKQARRLLGDPQMRITDVALAVGYQTPSAFTAAFRREVGSSPSDFRRMI